MATVVPLRAAAYPYDRLDALKQLADALPGGVVDCSIGTPCDPVPDSSCARSPTRGRASMGYPPSAGTRGVPRSGRGVDGAPLRRRRRAGEIACLRRHEGDGRLAAALPLVARPDRDTVLYPGGRLPVVRDGRDARAAAARCRFRSTPTGTSTSTRSPPTTPIARCCCGSTSRATRRRRSPTPVPRAGRGVGARHGVVVAERRVLRRVRAADRTTILAAGLDGVLAVHSLSKRSNLAGMRVGFFAGDPALVDYLVETRKHAGFMVPTPAQAAAVAALGDDAHVEVQRKRYDERRALAIDRLAAARPASRRRRDALLPLAARRRRRRRLGDRRPARPRRPARRRPATSTAEAGAAHVRLALVQPRATPGTRRSTDS